MTKFHKDHTLPQSGEIFVFGSNLMGIHGAGAARVAKDCFGAVSGVGFGRTGNAWAIPTKYEPVRKLPPEKIAWAVAEFLDEAELTPELTYFVTRVGCGLAGYQDYQIAPMFARAPDNCIFPEQWNAWL